MRITMLDDKQDDEVKVLIQLSDEDFKTIAKFDEPDKLLLRQYENSSAIADRLLALELIGRGIEENDGESSYAKLKRG